MNFTYLALGDSYTIGEGVLLSESFPFQTVQLLRQTAVGAESRRQGFWETPTAVETPCLPAGRPVGGWQFTAPEIVAKTGWTTDELDAAIQQTTFLEQYDVVTLLVGVNNQYRGRSVTEFKDEFVQLLQQAIAFAGGDPQRVFVLSIPDWGVTPFAEGRDREQIAVEIDAFNEVCATASRDLLSTYIDITGAQRADGNKPEFLAEDGLHPSGKEYAKWAGQLSEAIAKKLNG